jgi:hypothetical protein
LVCDGQVYCDQCHRYDRRLLEPCSLEDLARWGQRLCQAFGRETPLLAAGDPSPPGPFDFLADKKILMAEAHHAAGAIVFYPGGLRLATLCHELAHLFTGQDHTEAWARSFARLVAWVRQELPPDHYTAGMRANLLRPRKD